MLAIFVSLLILIGSTLTASAKTEVGIASIFTGGHTSDGRFLSRGDWGVAHKTLPIGTKIMITNRLTNAHVIVPVRDRGPYIRGRIVDCLPAVATMLGFVHRGLQLVEIRVVEWPRSRIIFAGAHHHHYHMRLRIA